LIRAHRITANTTGSKTITSDGHCGIRNAIRGGKVHNIITAHHCSIKNAIRGGRDHTIIAARHGGIKNAFRRGRVHIIIAAHGTKLKGCNTNNSVFSNETK
jgi:hypothetical protein